MWCTVGKTRHWLGFRKQVILIQMYPPGWCNAMPNFQQKKCIKSRFSFILSKRKSRKKLRLALKIGFIFGRIYGVESMEYDEWHPFIAAT